MTKEQLEEEYKWLIKNRLHPEFQERASIYNKIFKETKKARADEAKELTKTFKIGEVVKIDHHKAPGLWKITEIKIASLILKNIETQKSIKAKSDLLIKIDKEDSELISDLDEIGL